MLSWHQHLYYKNNRSHLYKDGKEVKFTRSQRQQILTWAIKHTRLRNETRPYFIFNGSHNIDFSGVNHAVDNTAFYFFEPLTFYNKNKQGYNDHILRFDDSNNVRSYEIDDVQRYIVKNKLKNCTVYLPEKFASQHFAKIYNLDFQWYDPYLHAESYRLNLLERFYPHCFYTRCIQKKLWLGTWRYDPVRHYIVADLVNRRCHLNNNFSWFYNIKPNEINTVMWSEMTDLEIKILTDLNQESPLNIDTDVKESVHYTNFYPPVQQKTKNPYKSYHECFCALVVETRVAQPWVNLSEKTLHAIKNRKPFLLYAAPRSLEALQQLGFKTFNDYWDESYDTITDTKKRIRAINSIAEYLNNLSLSDLKVIYENMKPILMHNLSVLKKMQRFD